MSKSEKEIGSETQPSVLSGKQNNLFQFWQQIKWEGEEKNPSTTKDFLWSSS